MREPDDIVEAEESGRTLDGMCRAENGIDVRPSVRVRLQLQQLLLHRIEQLTTFCKKGLYG